MKPCAHCGHRLPTDHVGACPACGVAGHPDEWAPDHSRKWLAGAVAPLPLLLLAIRCLVTQHAVLPGWRISLRVEGREAVAVGVALLSVALFVHARYFWGETWSLLRASDPGQIVGATSFVVSMGYLAVRLTRLA